MSAVLVQVADAVVAELKTGTEFSLQFEPVRSYQTETKLEDLDELRVDVVPVKNTSEHDDRTSLAYTCSVDIAVRKRFGADDQDSDSGLISRDSVDELVSLLEEINEFLAGPDHWRLSDYNAAAWQSGEIRTPWIPTHLRERQYTGILRVTYAVNKAI